MLINLHSVHNEIEYWKDSHVFRPERHLSAEGKIIRTDHFLPFGAIKSACSTSGNGRKNYWYLQANECASVNLLLRTRTTCSLPLLSKHSGSQQWRVNHFLLSIQ